MIEDEIFDLKLNFDWFRKAEFALQKVQMQELTDKGMVFDRFAVAYGREYFQFLNSN
jgi:hypothetical protein